jgi:oxalate decarboxylase
MFTNSSRKNESQDKKFSRREFLKLAGLAGAAGATLPSLMSFGQVLGSYGGIGGNGTNSNTNINQTTGSSGNTTMNQQSSSVRIFDLDGTKPQFQNAAGSRTIMNADNFPILSGMGAALLRLRKGGVREPHWHANAAELSYCITGNARMTIYSSNARKDTFTIAPGQLTFVPEGYWHDVENIGNEEAKFIVVYNSERPEDLGISGSVGSMPTQVLDRIFGINPPAFFDQLNYKSTQDIVIGQRPAIFSSINGTPTTNPHKFNLGGITPQIQTSGGTGKLGMADDFPILKGLALFLIDLKPTGIIEPHTHPNAAELNYVINGKVRFTVFGPGGQVATSEIGKGQVFFVPAGYFHYLENPDIMSAGTVASFFNSENPEFIGLVGGLSAYSNQVLGSVFSKEPESFNSLPRQVKNIFIASGTG